MHFVSEMASTKASKIPTSIRVLCGVLTLVVSLMSMPAKAQESEKVLLDQLRVHQSNPDATVQELEVAVSIVQRLLQDHSASDAAVSILLEESYDGIDFASFEKRLEKEQAQVPKLPTFLATSETLQDPKATCVAQKIGEQTMSDLKIQLELAEGGTIIGLPLLTDSKELTSVTRSDYRTVLAALDECAPFEGTTFGAQYLVNVSADAVVTFEAIQQQAPVNTSTPQRAQILPAPISPDLAEQALDLSRKDVREIQARLLVSGHDPNGVDGVIGAGTRSAISAWQAVTGNVVTGYLNEPQLQVLKANSQKAYEGWTQKERARVAAAKQAKPRSNRLRNGWYRDRRGMYCRKMKIGLQFCQPQKP